MSKSSPLNAEKIGRLILYDKPRLFQDLFINHKTNIISVIGSYNKYILYVFKNYFRAEKGCHIRIKKEGVREKHCILTIKDYGEKKRKV